MKSYKFLLQKLTYLVSIVALVCMMGTWTTAQAGPLGIYQGNGCDGVKNLPTFVNWFGRKPDFMLDFFAADSWTSMLSDANWTVGCWSNQKANVVFSIPMLPSGSTLAAGAAGDFDKYFVQMAQLLVNKGYGDAIIRLGWEFNGGWYPWAAAKDPENWVKYWRRIVTTMRAVPGADFLFDWCSTMGWQQLPTDKVYPGDEYVDIIGQDTYNQSWTAGVSVEQRWSEILNQQFGLNWLVKFARLHGKPISIPEWGTGVRPDGHGGGDDPYFVTQMIKWIKAHKPLYHSYWDFAAKDYNAKLSNGGQPLSAKAFTLGFKQVANPPVITQITASGG